MPTNFLRKRPTMDGRAVAKPVPRNKRAVWLAIDDAESVLLRLHDTPTAELIWRALPIYSVVEVWGESLHFEVPVRAGRDRTARLNGRSADVYYWADDQRIVLAWGPTPISRDNEIRLMRPCNVWGAVDGDPSIFSDVVPGAKVALTRAQEKSA